MLIMATVLFPIVAGIGCSVTVYEDGTARTSQGYYVSREAVLAGQSGCLQCPIDVRFASQAAYDNFMAWARNYIAALGYRNPPYEERLQRLEQARYPPGTAGIVLPSTTTEGGHTGGGAKSGGGK